MTAWVFEGEKLACQWSEVGQRTLEMPPWMDEPMHGSYLPPPPDFASHSPFGGADWFTPHLHLPTDSESDR